MSAVAALAERTSMRDVATLDALYEEAARVGFTPGWVPRKKPILWAEPKSEFVPAHWRWQDARAGLDAALMMRCQVLSGIENIEPRCHSKVCGFF